jgi:hypothetical protein
MNDVWTILFVLLLVLVTLEMNVLRCQRRTRGDWQARLVQSAGYQNNRFRIVDLSPFLFYTIIELIS